MFRGLALALAAVPCLVNCTTVIRQCASEPCTCPDGSESVQSCRDDGTLGTCECSPVGACATDADCPDNAACTQSHGDYACTCNPGFGGDGAFCDPYPPKPYGTTVRTVIKNIELSGYLEPSSPERSWGPVRLDHFYDPRGVRGPNGGPLKALMVMVGSAACGRCNAKAPLVRKLCEDARADGLACMTALQKGVNDTAATKEDAEFWASKHKIDYPIEIDPNWAWAPYIAEGGSISYPAFVFLNTRDMRIAAIRGYTDDLEAAIRQVMVAVR